jgi:hypothetical protein
VEVAEMSAVAHLSRGRPRGFIDDWKPRADTASLITSIRSVLKEYEAYLPLTIRQIFYRLVVNFSYEKNELGYKRLCEVSNKARRARLVPFDAIRDDGFHRTDFVGWDDMEEARDYLARQAKIYRIDRQRHQDSRLVVWCEAQGMVPQLERVTASYSIPVYSSGGFDSVTVKHAVAQEFSNLGNVIVLHIGDHDPSGVHVFGSLDEDITAFLGEFGGYAEFVRLAVIPEQIEHYGLPTAPPKVTDRRAFTGLTTQAEALPPDLLALILEKAIKERFDLDGYQQALDEEAEERTRLLAWLEAGK